MTNEITITLPAIDESIIETIKTENEITLKNEAQAVRVLREKYSALARQAGNVRIGNRRGGNSNYNFDDSVYLLDDKSRKIKALLCVDGFDSKKTGDWRGCFVGTRLYLAADGRWIEISRSGSWSSYQGSTDSWSCGEVDYNDSLEDDESAYPGYERPGGHVKTLTDDQVAASYKLDKLIAGLGESLATLAEKLPQRLAVVRRRAVFAGELLAKLK